MPETILNLTAILVNREVEDFLEDYPPGHPHKIIFSLPYFQQRLIAEILSNIPNRHVVVGDVKALANHGDYLLYSLEERLRVETLIKKIIPDLLMENPQKIGLELAREREKINLALSWEENYN